MDLLTSTISPALDVFRPTYDWLATEDAGGGAPFVWGITLRAVCVIMCVNALSLTLQIRALSGADGISPAREFLARVWRDFGWKGLLYWPSVYWSLMLLPVAQNVAHDVALMCVTASGAVAAGYAAIFGGELTGACFAWCYVVMLSVDAGAHTLAYPWDSLMFEALFLGAWMPPLLPLTTSVAISQLPTPLLAWCYRWSITRLLVGFGKLKFMGSTSRDKLYIREFLISQPIPSYEGLLMHRYFPKWVWTASLIGMFIVEIPLPLAAFIAPASWGWMRVITVALVCGLMLGIQVSGNFGYFNLLTCALCLPWLHHNATIFSVDAWAQLFDTPAHVAFTVVFVAYVLPASTLAFVMNSWMNLAWQFWPGWASQHPRWLFTSFVTYLRAFAPLRIVQAFGVFPPNAFPGQRMVVRFEVSVASTTKQPENKQKQWLQLPAKFFDKAGLHVAPHHPRFDHAVFYESMGLTGYAFGNILGHHSPYKVGYESSEWVRTQLRIAAAHLPPPLRSSTQALGVFQENAAAQKAASHLRAELPANTRVMDALFWPPRDRNAQNDKRSPFYGFEYVGPVTAARASLIHQLPDFGAAPGTAALKESCLGEHLPSIVACHALRRGVEVVLAIDETFEALRQGSAAGPEEFFWDYVFWRRAAETTAGSVTPEEYEEAWAFIARVRALAAKVTATPEPASPVRPCALGTPELASVDEINAATRVRVRTPQDVRARAAATFVADDHAQDPVPIEGVNAVFTIPNAAAVMKEIRLSTPPLTLLRVRRTINRLAVPLLRSCERVFWRPPPTAQELTAELASAISSGGAHGDAIASDPEWREWYLQVADMIGGTPEHARGVPPGSVPASNGTTPTFTCNGDSYEVLHIADNDDAGVAGCMRSTFRIGMFAMWAMLVRGRKAYEHAVGGASSVLGRRLPTGFTGVGARDDITTLPVAALCHRVVPDLTLAPHAMPTDAGLFLHMVLNFDVYAQTARRGRVQGLVMRPATNLPPTNLKVLPGFLEVTDRLNIHTALRAWDFACGDFVPDPAAPSWGFRRDGEWVLLRAAAANGDETKESASK